MAQVALTGRSGAVGGAIMDALVARGHTVTSVGRGADDVHWDMREPIPPAAVEAFQSVDAIVHAAADINLASTHANLRRVNVDAVREVVASAASAPCPPRLVHVSSAYVDGDAGPSNGYEQTKREAEEVVLAGPSGASILRPSLVMGRSTDGAIHRFSGMYIFIRMLRFGLIPAIPGFQAVGVDVVPVDVVAAHAVREAERMADGTRVVSVTAGPAAPCVEELVTVACDVFDARTGERVDRPKFVRPDVYHRLFRSMIMDRLSPAQRLMLETVEVFLPYFERDHVFGSGIATTRSELLTTWRKSVERWLDDIGGDSARGHLVWARRR